MVSLPASAESRVRLSAFVPPRWDDGGYGSPSPEASARGNLTISVKLNYVTKKSSSNNLDCFNRDRRGYDGAVKRQSGLAGFVASRPAFAKMLRGVSMEMLKLISIQTFARANGTRLAHN